MKILVICGIRKSRFWSIKQLKIFSIDENYYYIGLRILIKFKDIVKRGLERKINFLL